MKILHTSDWHLGQRLKEKERFDEHIKFTDWLINQINIRQIDVLIIAGDVFDSCYPSNSALSLYYDFLTRLQTTCCSNAVITAGNHDSGAAINAPKNLLKHFKIFVCGNMSKNISDEILILKNKEAKDLCVVCAVPFIRERDVRKSIPGESYIEKEKCLIEGVISHYNDLFEETRNLKKFMKEKIPVVATGHFFAAGGKKSDSEKDIYIGNLGKIDLTRLIGKFDYFALGHLHNSQRVANLINIRYSGSPIPLSFGENNDKKNVIAVEFQDENLKDIVEIQIPVFRKLIRIQADLENVSGAIETASAANKGLLNPFVQIDMGGELSDVSVLNSIYETAAKHGVELLSIQKENSRKSSFAGEIKNADIDLDFLSPVEVFKKLFATISNDNYDFEEMISAFNELLENPEVREYL